MKDPLQETKLIFNAIQFKRKWIVRVKVFDHLFKLLKLVFDSLFINFIEFIELKSLTLWVYSSRFPNMRSVLLCIKYDK